MKITLSARGEEEAINSEIKRLVSSKKSLGRGFFTSHQATW